MTHYLALQYALKQQEKLINKNTELQDELSIMKKDHEWKNNEYKKLLDSFMALKEKYQKVKKDNDRLVSETAKVIAEHQAHVIELIDKKIEEAEKRECDCSKCVASQVLFELKEEL